LSAPGSLPSYETFYGLAQPPFALAPDPAFLYLSPSHEVAMRQIVQALRRREPFIVLSGDIGTGKTTLCRALLRQLDKTTLASLVLNPFLSIDELLRQVLVDFGVVSSEGAHAERFTSAATHQLASALGEFLQTLAPLRGSAVLVIDEAQHLSPRVLEELRVLSGLGGHDARLLQIVLVGQPDLLEGLAASDMRQLDQRISLKAMLAPLDVDEVQHYIEHRLTVAGESVSVLFEKKAIKRLHALSGGVPRVLNQLCDRALMAGAERGVHEITPELVDRAADALSFRRRPAPPAPRGWRRPALIAAATALLAALGLALFAPVHRIVAAEPPPLPPAPPPDIRALAPPTIEPDAIFEGDAVRPRVPLPPGETPDDAVVARPSP
jgi:general secretion pathway protein A